MLRICCVIGNKPRNHPVPTLLCRLVSAGLNHHLVFLKINVDRVVFPNHVGIGSVARDCEGNFIASFQSTFRGHIDPREVEAMTIREVLSWVKGKSGPMFF